MNDTSELFELLDHIFSVALRRRWWFSVATCVVAIGASLGSFLIPNRYKSEATILVQQQQIPERYVVPNNTMNLNQVLQAMRHDVLSRPQLLKIISDFNLYAAQKKHLSSEQMVGLMQKDITIESLDAQDQEQRAADAFKITYIGDEPATVQHVTSRLTSLFINEDLRSQEQRDVNTTIFLENQLASAQTDMTMKQKRLRDFKMANLGELPEEQQSNLQILNGLESQLQNTNAALARASEQRAYLQSSLAQYQNLAVGSGSLAATTIANPVEMAQAELNRLQSERAALLGTFSPRYPDVKRVDHQIGEAQASLAQLQKDKAAAQNSGGSSSGSVTSFGSERTDAAVAQLNSQLKANELEVADDAKQMKQLQDQISEYQHRLNLTPVREQQLTDLLNQYQLAKKNYDELYAKRTESALATDLHKDQQGQQFRLIDPPNLPTKPFTPDRLKIAIGGLATGIAIGVGLAFFIEIRDTSLHSEKELRVHFNQRILMGVPLFVSARERRIRSVKAALQWCVGTMMVLGVLATEYYVYRRG